MKIHPIHRQYVTQTHIRGRWCSLFVPLSWYGPTFLRTLADPDTRHQPTNQPTRRYEPSTTHSGCGNLNPPSTKADIDFPPNEYPRYQMVKSFQQSNLYLISFPVFQRNATSLLQLFRSWKHSLEVHIQFCSYCLFKVYVYRVRNYST